MLCFIKIDKIHYDYSLNPNGKDHLLKALIIQ